MIFLFIFMYDAGAFGSSKVLYVYLKTFSCCSAHLYLCSNFAQIKLFATASNTLFFLILSWPVISVINTCLIPHFQIHLKN